MDETILIEEAKKGDKTAFEKLISKYQQKVYNYSLRMTGDPALSEDICQEALIKAYFSITSFRGDSSFSTWLYRIIYNTCKDHWRKEGRSSGMKVCFSEDDADEIKSVLTEAASRLFYDRLRQEELQDWIANLITQLPPEFRTILILRDIQGFSFQEIAEIADASIGTVKSRLNRARNQLRAILSGNF
ncbi:MAG: sigma-70 family RNA polymerase sigma factor [Nitrospirae bacterium]|nr:sigma-70 family RNA polymerase sigma factor [Nitrospirota bacterium]